MIKLLVATNNQGKQLEFASSLSSVAQLVFPNQLEELTGFVPKETGGSYRENALIKAREFAGKANLMALADDSGIEIAALGGQPGIHSKRFFGEKASERVEHILQLLEHQSDRRATFKTVMALVWPDGRQEVFSGSIEGQIAHSSTGLDGFEYDFIFIPKGYDQTFAELGRTIKDKIGHRGQALAAVKQYLVNNFGD